MAEPDANKPQVTDPATVADLVRLLQVRGAIGVLDVADIVVPTISLGDVVTRSFNIRSPAFRSADVFSAGLQTAPAAGAILADTAALPAGTYDLMVLVNPTSDNSANDRSVDLEHRNAANTANLMLVQFNASRLIGAGVPLLSFGYELAVNERLRIITGVASAPGEIWGATIFARIR